MDTHKKEKSSSSIGPKTYSNLHDLKDVPISKNLDENESYLNELFADCSDVIIRPFQSDPGLGALAVLVDGLVNSVLVQRSLEMLMTYWQDEPDDLDSIMERVIPASQVKMVSNYEDMLEGVLSGDSALLMDGNEQALLIQLRAPNLRSISKPSTEEIVRGPQEGFIEGIRINTSLVRRRIKTPHLKMKPLLLGRHTRTDIVVSYVEGIVDPHLLSEVLDRLGRIDVDAIFETGQLEEYIQDSAYSPFPQVQISERPDAVCAALMNGRIAIFVDGTPMVMIIPTVFINFLLTVEDHYERFQFSTFLRWLRYAFLILSLFVPAWFVAATTYHPEMIPTSLLLSICAARELIPFPAVVEVLIMEIIFEALREAGIRLPKQIGSALSILGALIIGQAAVEAGIVSAPVVIVVSITGIASFTLPQYNGAVALRLLRFPLIILGSILGFYGIMLGGMLLIGHMANLRSFGVPYLSPLAPASSGDAQMTLIRLPHWASVRRPSYLHPQDEIRRSIKVKRSISKNKGSNGSANPNGDSTGSSRASKGKGDSDRGENE
ncbi:spore germination protein [Gorillibacterium timonense]|uniref:spore germination protein n=1 Tax=Gorillibacterium timonense TaxID=1689269 RepID=UPI00071E4323|nr:spore germination protein [Gorillibacterium timonense]